MPCLGACETLRSALFVLLPFVALVVELIELQVQRIVVVRVHYVLTPIVGAEVNVVRMLCVFPDLYRQDPVLDGNAECAGVLDESVNGSDVNVISHDRSLAWSRSQLNSRSLPEADQRMKSSVALHNGARALGASCQD